MSKNYPPIRGANRLAQSLKSAGVEVVFSLSGNQIMPIYDAFIDTGARIVHTRHEGAAVLMAEAYAQLRDTIAVALVTAGPGFGNALGALFSATKSSSPVVLLSGDSPIGRDGHGAFQELDQLAASAPFVKFGYRLTLRDDPAEVFAQAAAIAQNGVPGPVHLALPADVLLQSCVFEPRVIPSEPIAPPARMGVDQGEFDRLRQRFEAASRPLVLAARHLFRGEQRATPAMLADAVDAPVVVLESPRGLRDPALGALPELLKASDCLLYLGQPVDFMSGFADASFLGDTELLMLSEDSAALEQAQSRLGSRLSAATQASVRIAIDRWIDDQAHREAGATRASWRASANAAMAHRELQETSAAGAENLSLLKVLRNHLDSLNEPILVCDGGEIGQWAQAFLSADRRLINGPSGAIGGALPYAIGAKIACPDASVVAIMGDGTCGFYLAEFETAARESLPVTVVIGNDSRWNAEHWIQQRDFGPERLIACTLTEQVRYDQVAEGLGCSGLLINDSNSFAAALAAANESEKPVCMNVIIAGAPAPVYTHRHVDDGV